MKKYLVVIEETDTGYSAYSPDLAGCVSTGATRDEVERNMREAIRFHVDGLDDASMESKNVLVCGAGGFIGSHLVRRLANEGCWVRGVDLKYPEFGETHADDFVIGDLRDPVLCRSVVDRRFDEVYQLAADMGGAGFVFTGENDADIMPNSALINLNMLEACHRRNVKRVFYSSSAACIPNTTRWTRTTPAAPRTPPIRPTPTLSTAVGNCSVSGCISRSAATTAWRSGSPGSTTSSGRRNLAGRTREGPGGPVSEDRRGL